MHNRLDNTYLQRKQKEMGPSLNKVITGENLFVS